MPQGHALTKRSDRIAWLVAHPEIIEGFDAKMRADPEREKTNKPVILKMKDAGLIAVSTYWGNVNLESLIEEARASITVGGIIKKAEESNG